MWFMGKLTDEAQRAKADYTTCGAACSPPTSSTWRPAGREEQHGRPPARGRQQRAAISDSQRGRFLRCMRNVQVPGIDNITESVRAKWPIGPSWPPPRRTCSEGRRRGRRKAEATGIWASSWRITFPRRGVRPFRFAPGGAAGSAIAWYVIASATCSPSDGRRPRGAYYPTTASGWGRRFHPAMEHLTQQTARASDRLRLPRRAGLSTVGTWRRGPEKPQRPGLPRHCDSLSTVIRGRRLTACAHSRPRAERWFTWAAHPTQVIERTFLKPGRRSAGSELCRAGAAAESGAVVQALPKPDVALDVPALRSLTTIGACWDASVLLFNGEQPASRAPRSWPEAASRKCGDAGGGNDSPTTGATVGNRNGDRSLTLTL